MPMPSTPLLSAGLLLGLLGERLGKQVANGVVAKHRGLYALRHGGVGNGVAARLVHACGQPAAVRGAVSFTTAV